MTKTAIITGGTSGIGLDIASYLFNKNFNISIAGIATNKVINKLKKKFSSKKVLILNLNLTKKNNIKKFVKSTQNKFKTIDVLINCAGKQHVSPIEKFSDETWNYILDINLTAPFYMIKETLPIMRKNKWGRIINITSAHGAVGSEFKAGYVASKHGLVGLTKVVALETAKEKITCNAIGPGFVYTDLVSKQILKLSRDKKISVKNAEKTLISKHPSMNFIQKNDVSSLVYYLTKNVSSQITGSHLIIDGGWTAQ